MNKKEIINEINKLNFDKNEFWVLGSSSLVLRDIIEEANDIDLAITNELYKSIVKKYKLTYLGVNHNSKWYRINDVVECCVIEKENVEIISPFNLIDLEYYYNTFIKNSIREKDKDKKIKIEKYLKNTGVNYEYNN